MNLKTTALLILVATAVGVVVILNPFKQGEAKENKSPWFYQVSEDDIQTISINHQGENVKFRKVANYTWAFEGPGDIPPDHVRWGGIPLLLSGPGTKRDLTAVQPTIDNPAQYGLDDPNTIVDVGLTANRQIQFRLGDKTTDGGHHYGQVVGFPDLFLIASTWGDVISRLAKEPPLPKWAVERAPKTIDELNIYYGNPSLETTPMLSFSQDFETSKWSVQYFYEDEEPTPVDPERWKDIFPLVNGPDNITVAVPSVEDRDYVPWGITDDSKAIEIRFSGLTDSGTRFTDGVLLRLGNKTEDGRYYYAKSESNYSRQPVLNLDAQWVDTVLNLRDDIPYGEKPEPEEPATAP
jgi:hypothetical protein